MKELREQLVKFSERGRAYMRTVRDITTDDSGRTAGQVRQGGRAWHVQRAASGVWFVTYAITEGASE